MDQTIQLVKRCTTCGEHKPREAFYKNPLGRLGIGSKCRDCERKKSEAMTASGARQTPERRAYMRVRMADFRAKHQGYYDTEEMKESKRRAEKTRKEKHPERLKAKTAINNLIRCGGLPRTSAMGCIECGKQAEHWHHSVGYGPDFVFCVVPVCHPCHRKIHWLDSPNKT